MTTSRRLALVLFLLLLTVFLTSTVHPASLRDVAISEIAWSGTTVSPNDEWIELFNNSGASVDLAGWTLDAVDGEPSISLSGTIPAGGYFLLERTDDATVPGVGADQFYTGALSNDGEDLILRDDTLVVVDQVNNSTGWFAGHDKGHVPMVRVDTAEDGNQASNWTYNPRCGSATNSTGASRTCEPPITYLPYPLSYAVYFNERATTATDTTTDHTPMEDALLAFINGATTSIDIALYGLNRQSVVDTLIAAHSRSVIVRVVGDDKAGSGEYSSSYQELINAGITVVTDTNLAEIQHNKFLIVDGSVVWTGSTNFTDTGFTLNANNSIAITDTTLAEVYTKEFEEMWTGNFDDNKTDNTDHLFDCHGTGLESYFSPTDLVAFEVWDELANANKTVHFGMFFWTDDLLTNRTIERLNGGVKVYGVWDRLGAPHPSSAYPILCEAGAQIMVEDFSGKVHHKFAVIDVEGSDPTVILGSYNWSEKGAYGNDENTLVIHDHVLAQAYYAEWQTLWSAIGSENMCPSSNMVYLPAILK